MQKRAQGLPLNTVILAILVVLVLFVVAAFFLSGTSGISKQIRSIFYKGVEGQDRVFAVQTCQQRCDQVKGLSTSSVSSVPKSAYCAGFFYIDSRNIGEADYTTDPPNDPNGKKVYTQYTCWKKDPTHPDTSLDVPCSLDNGDTPDVFCNKGYKPK